MKLNISSIAASPDCQARVGICEQTVREYVERLEAGEEAPAVVVFFDGKVYWLADGFHRFHSHQRAQRLEIEADIREGTRRDARMFACGANTGLRRTRADKRRAVEILLGDEEWRTWSDREIARRTGVTPTFVGTVRTSLSIMDTSDPSQLTFDGLRRGGDGVVRRMPRIETSKSHPASGASSIFAKKTRGSTPDKGSGGSFDIAQAERELMAALDAEMQRWPEEKRHAMCVMLRNFTTEKDPEFPFRRLDAIDEAYRSEAERGGAA